MSWAVCGCVACPAGLAGVFPAMKGLLFEMLGLQSNEGLGSGFPLPSAHQPHQRRLPLERGPGQPTCLPPQPRQKEILSQHWNPFPLCHLSGLNSDTLNPWENAARESNGWARLAGKFLPASGYMNWGSSQCNLLPLPQEQSLSKTIYFKHFVIILANGVCMCVCVCVWSFAVKSVFTRAFEFSRVQPPNPHPNIL